MDLLYEAAVGGAIPVIRPLRESLAGERVVRVMGIVNGTTNYILTRMTDEGLDYDEALAEAQALGLAERDPSADVEGDDAAAKAAILAGLAFGSDLVGAASTARGSPACGPSTWPSPGSSGYVVKLLAVAELVERRPRRLGAGPPGDGAPLAPAGLGARLVQRRLRRGRRRRRAHALRPRRRRGAHGQRRAGRPDRRGPQPAHRRPPAPRPVAAPRRCGRSTSSTRPSTSRLDVVDRPGVLAAVAKVFGDHGVSIRAMEQVGLGDEARLIFLTHTAREGDVGATIAELRHWPPSTGWEGSCG